MALFIPGMRCSISDKLIPSASEAVVFPAFISNTADPLHIFSDAIILASVFKAHPLAAKAQARYEEFMRRTQPQARYCSICGLRILDPDNYLALGHLVDDLSHELHGYNYNQFHRTCLATWPQLSMLIDALERLNHSGTWAGAGLAKMIDELASLNMT
jgi:hypothetical protein